MIKVKQVIKDKANFYQVSFSNQQNLRISEDLLVRYRLLKDTEISEERFAEIQKSIGYDLGLQLAMNYISYQLRTEQEMLRYLRDKQISLGDSQQIIARLKELSLVDDINYGQSYIRTQLRLSDKGPQAVIQQLKKKGLKDEVIHEVIGLYSSEDQYRIAFQTAEKSLKAFRGKSHKEKLQKLRLKLLQKGFSQEIISQVMSEIPVEQDAEEEWLALKKAAEKLLRRYASDTFKLKQKLFQKGFDLDSIQRYIDEEVTDEC